MKGKVVTRRDPLRMHSNPFLEAPVVGSLDKGAVVEILSVKNGWFQVKTEVVGWVDSEFMRELTPPRPDAFPPKLEIPIPEPFWTNTKRVIFAVGIFLTAWILLALWLKGD